MRVGKAVGRVLVGLVDGLPAPIAILIAWILLFGSSLPTVALGVALAVYLLAVVLAVALSFRAGEAFPLTRRIVAVFKRIPIYVRGIIWT